MPGEALVTLAVGFTSRCVNHNSLYDARSLSYVNPSVESLSTTVELGQPEGSVGGLFSVQLGKTGIEIH
jgi:hypothetical protein